MKKSTERKSVLPAIAALKRAAEATAALTNSSEDDGGYSAQRRDRSVKTAKPGRKCKCCGAALSVYNADDLCRPCDTAISEWKNFPWRRGEIEREMSPHCLSYVREHFPQKKKRSHGEAGVEVSSGSFARAMGRKEVAKGE